MKRRRFIKKGILGSIGLGILTGVYTWKIEPFWLEFVKLKMPIKNLPDNLIGKKLIQISDIHVGDDFDYQYIIDSFNKTQKLNPDFVVYTGDYVSYKNNKQINQLKTVLKHAVKGKLATVAILGNHDYGHNWSEKNVAEAIVKELNNSGIETLRNDQKSYNGLNIIGIDDFWGTNFKPKKVLNHIDNNIANLVLCHNPDVCDLKIWNGYQDWILSGHTHGGQIKPPFLQPPVLPVKNKKYVSGKINLKDGRTLYINRALGSIKSLRFNVRPEITVFELVKA